MTLKVSLRNQRLKVGSREQKFAMAASSRMREFIYVSFYEKYLASAKIGDFADPGGLSPSSEQVSGKQNKDKRKTLAIRKYLHY